MFPKVGAVNTTAGSNISSQAYTNDPDELSSHSKFAAHITDKFQSATTPLIINKQALFEDAFESAATTLNIDASIHTKTKALFSAFGVTQGRPEILSVVDFEPIFMQNAIDRTDAGTMLDAQFTMRALRKEKILKFREQLLATPATATLLDELRASLIENTTSIVAHAATLVEINARLINMQRALNMHSTTSAAAIKKAAKLYRSSTGTSFDVFTPKALLVDVLGFHPNAVDEFMSTKILLQLLSAFKGLLNNYSTKLFDTKFNDDLFGDDDSLIDIIPPNYQNNFQFSNSVIKNADGPLNILEWDHYQALLGAVPDDLFSKVTLFLHTVARELKVSAGITRTDVLPIAQAKTGGDFSKIFDVIVGEIGSNVFTHIPNATNLAGLVKINNPTIDGDILPFESHEIIYQHDTFVPAKAFIDIATTYDGTKFNTEPLQEFVNQYDTATSLMTSMIEKLLFLFDKSTMLDLLSAKDQLIAMLTPIAETVAVLKGGVVGSAPVWPAGDHLLLIKAAASDPQIRYNLFRAFIYHATNSVVMVQGSFWAHLANSIELPDFNKVKGLLIAGLRGYAHLQAAIPLEGSIDWGTSRTWEQIESSIDNMFISSFGKKMPLNHIRIAIETVFYAAQSLANKSLIIDQDTTIFNGMHLSMIAYMIFDVFISLVDAFSVVRFSQQDINAEYIHVRAANMLNDAAAAYLKVIPTDGDGDAQGQAITDAFVAVNGGTLLKGQDEIAYRKIVLQQHLNRLREEEKIARTFVALFKAIGTNLIKAKDKIVDAFDLTNAESKAKLAFLTDTIEAQTQISLFDHPQIALIIELVERAAKQIGSADFPVAFIGQFDYNKRHLNVINAFMRTQQMLDKNVRLLTVGIPGGTMSGMLSQQIDVTSADEFNAPTKLPRPVIIHVYAKNLEYPALVFKPQQFPFDVDRFVQFDDIDGAFDDENITMDFAVKNIVQHVRAGSSTVKSSEGRGYQSLDYSGKAHAVGKHIVSNHLKSELLGHYIKLLSGVSMSESDFPTNSNIVTEQHSTESLAKVLLLIDRYLSDIAGEQLNLDDLKLTNATIASLLTELESTNAIVAKTGAPINVKLPAASSTQLVNLTEGIVNFLDTFSADSFLNDGSMLADRILAPKLFERIFHVAVNPHEFVIDEDKTAATDAGKKFLDMMTNTLLVGEPGSLKLRPDLVDITMHELFTSVSTLSVH